jgi:hypothetical protein
MKVLGVGLGKTGTTSLHRALQILGFKCIHYDQIRLNDILYGLNPCPDFRTYDDVDAVTDEPAAYFYRELLRAYPECKAILTVRDVDGWWRSKFLHAQRFSPRQLVIRSYLAKALYRLGLRASPWESHGLRVTLGNCIYGSVVPNEFLYKKRYMEHNERVQADIPAHRLLVMNVIEGDGWDKLCPFLGSKIPSFPFPHENPKPPEPGEKKFLPTLYSRKCPR